MVKSRSRSKSPKKSKSRSRSRSKSPSGGKSTGWCCGCRAMRSISGGKNTRTKNGRNMVKGKCSKCGTTMCRFVKG